ncbi:TIGR02285 family protein [Pseudoalteromonas sp. MMG005]|uniref:TIGR02285 family protein n=1 Tax=Pseudoalteromonas sp. MMG005 TaxID=2822682 RepID=UPI001FFD5AA2|nr:TIGR02285 family protein [Pseudoalteromonas sp. MMG005]
MLHLFYVKQFSDEALRTIAIIILCWVCTTNANTINWIKLDFAPYYILNGELQGAGRDEQIISLLQTAMPNYQFVSDVLPASRAIHELSNPSKTRCIVSLYKTKKRQQFIQFTDHYSTIGLSPSISLRKDTIKALNLKPGQKVSLIDLLKEHKLTVGVALNRSFGKKIDTILSELPSEQLLLRPGKDPLKSLTYMLLKQRLDIIIGYPSEHYHLQTTLKDKDQLAQLIIAETNAITHGYVGCTKNSAGAQLVSHLNIALKHLYANQKFNDVMLKWLPNELKAQLNSHLH